MTIGAKIPSLFCGSIFICRILWKILTNWEMNLMNKSGRHQKYSFKIMLIKKMSSSGWTSVYCNGVSCHSLQILNWDALTFCFLCHILFQAFSLADAGIVLIHEGGFSWKNCASLKPLPLFFLGLTHVISPII